MGTERIVKLLNDFLNFLNDNGDPLPMELVNHNLSPDRNRSLSEFAKIDADMVLQVNSISRRSSVDLRDYRLHQEFARDLPERRVVLHIVITAGCHTTWVIHVPLQCLMIGFGDSSTGYHCYGHGITFLNDNGLPEKKELFYCGITKRGWLKRMAEHFRDISKGSNKTFHKRWRQSQGRANILLNSELVAVNHNYVAAMNWEEWIVERYTKENRSLNMIPGGFAGIRKLASYGLLSKSKKSDISKLDRTKK